MLLAMMSQYFGLSSSLIFVLILLTQIQNLPEGKSSSPSSMCSCLNLHACQSDFVYKQRQISWM